MSYTSTQALDLFQYLKKKRLSIEEKQDEGARSVLT